MDRKIDQDRDQDRDQDQEGEELMGNRMRTRAQGKNLCVKRWVRKHTLHRGGNN